MNICIVGSGNIAHALVCILGKNNKNNISVLSSNKNLNNKIVGYLDSGDTIEGTIKQVSNDAQEILKDSQLILFTVPSFARKQILNQINLFIPTNCIIGSFHGTGGFNDEVENIIGEKSTSIFSAQRVPCIARVINKGKSVKISLKDTMSVAINKDQVKIKYLLESLFTMDIFVLDDFMEVNLSNSNPILHTARLFSILKNNKDKELFENKILFYEEWDDDSSEILLRMDEEFMTLVKKLNLKNVKSLKEHYNVSNIKEMTNKISSIESFKGIKTPMVKLKNEYIVDFNSRYITEDVNVGLKYIIDSCNKYNVKNNYLMEVYDYLTRNKLRIYS